MDNTAPIIKAIPLLRCGSINKEGHTSRGSSAVLEKMDLLVLLSRKACAFYFPLVADKDKQDCFNCNNMANKKEEPAATFLKFLRSPKIS